MIGNILLARKSEAEENSMTDSAVNKEEKE
jgi:hypothetical protein